MKMSRHLSVMEDCIAALNAMAGYNAVIHRAKASIRHYLAKAVSSDRCLAKVANTFRCPVIPEASSGHYRAIPAGDDNPDQSVCRDASPGAE